MAPLDQLHEESSLKEEMSFIDHLEALRWHIIRGVVAILVFMIAAFVMKEQVFDLIFAPTKADFLTYRFTCWASTKLSLDGMLCFQPVSFRFINIEMAGQFLVHLKVSLMLGFIIAFPYAFWEVWRFVKPGLYHTEVKYTRGIVFFSSFLFLTGVSFGYFILTPFALNFFGSYQVTPEVSNDFTLTNYIGFLTMFIMLSGIIFELPIVVYFLSKLGLVTPQFMREYRRHASVIILVISAIITPADIGTQLLVFVPVFFLYEISIFISAYVQRNMEKEDI